MCSRLDSMSTAVASGACEDNLRSTEPWSAAFEGQVDDSVARASQCNPCASWPLSYKIGGEFANGLWNSRLRILNLYASPASTTSAEGANQPTYSLQQVAFSSSRPTHTIPSSHFSVSQCMSFSRRPWQNWLAVFGLRWELLDDWSRCTLPFSSVHPKSTGTYGL